MDEATAFADPDSELEIQKALNALIKDRTVLVIAHRLNAILGADQIAVMEQGKIIALGTHHELLDNVHYQAFEGSPRNLQVSRSAGCCQLRHTTYLDYFLWVDKGCASVALGTA